jgi:hypothetical protein
MAFYPVNEPLPQGLKRRNVRLYHRPNGSSVYIDMRFPLNEWCNATISADSDIAGPGTLLAFVIPALITITAAIVRAACFGTLDYYQRKSNPTVNASTLGRWRLTTRRCLNLIAIIDTLLISLSDVQVFTGSAIIIAAFLQGPELSFYHEEIIVRYWYLIMNSLWATERRAATAAGSVGGDDAVMDTIRKCLTLLALVPFLAFDARELVRQSRDWDFLDGRRCYRYPEGYGFDDSGRNIEEWVTMAGISFYAILLSLSIFKTQRKSLDSMSEKVQKRILELGDKAAEDLDELQTQPIFRRGTTNYPASRKSLSIPQTLRLFLSTILHATLALIAFITFQAFAIWCYADGYEPIQVSWYTYEAAKQTIALYKLKKWDRELIVGDESSWRFGQCLPLVMLGAMLFTVYMMFHERHVKTVKTQ